MNTTNNLTDNEIFAIRSTTEDCDLSRVCSAALWGATHQARAANRRKVARKVAR